MGTAGKFVAVRWASCSYANDGARRALYEPWRGWSQGGLSTRFWIRRRLTSDSNAAAVRTSASRRGSATAMAGLTFVALFQSGAPISGCRMQWTVRAHELPDRLVVDHCRYLCG